MSDTSQELRYIVRVDFSKIEADIKEIQRKFDQNPIKLKLTIDDANLRQIAQKVSAATGGMAGGSMGMSGSAGYAAVSGAAASVAGNLFRSTHSAPVASSSFAPTVSPGVYSAPGMSCPQCGKVVPPGSPSCPYCGFDLRTAHQKFAQGHPVLNAAIQTTEAIGRNAIGAARVVGGAAMAMTPLGIGAAKVGLAVAAHVTAPVAAGAIIAGRAILGMTKQAPKTMDDIYDKIGDFASNSYVGMTGMIDWMKNGHEMLNNSINSLPSSIGAAVAGAIPKGYTKRRRRKPRGGGGGGGFSNEGQNLVSDDERSALDLNQPFDEASPVAHHPSPFASDELSAANMELTKALGADITLGGSQQSDIIRSKRRSRYRGVAGQIRYGGDPERSPMGLGSGQRQIEKMRAELSALKHPSISSELISAGHVFKDDFIMGNPPFMGAATRANLQTGEADIDIEEKPEGGAIHNTAKAHMLRTGLRGRKNAATGLYSDIGGAIGKGAKTIGKALGGGGRLIGNAIAGGMDMAGIGTAGAVTLGAAAVYGIGVQEMGFNNTYQQGMASGDINQQAIATAQYRNSSFIPGMATISEAMFHRERNAIIQNADRANRNKYQYQANRNNREFLGIQAATEGMSDDITNRLASASDSSTAERDAIKEQKGTSARELRDLAAGKFNLAKSMSPLDKEKVKALKAGMAFEVQAQAEDASAVKLTGAVTRKEAAEKAAMLRGENARRIGAWGQLKATNLSGVNEDESQRALLTGNYNAAMAGTDSAQRKGELTAQYGADVAQQNRQIGVRNFGMWGNVGVQNANNYAAQLGLQGNGIGSQLAGIQAGRMSSKLQMQMALVGVDKNSSQGMAIVGQNEAQQNALNIQDAQARKDYGINMRGIDASNTSAYQSLNHNFLGANLTSINAADDRAKSELGVHSGQYNRLRQGFNIQRREAAVNEENRSLVVGLDTSRIETAGRAEQLASGGQELGGALESIRGNSEADIKGVRAMNITDAEKNARIKAIGEQTQGQLAGIKRTARHRMFGGTSVSFGNFINFAQDSTRDRDPQENMSSVIENADKIGAGITGTQAETKAAVSRTTDENKKVGAENAGLNAQSANKDWNDQHAGTSGDYGAMMVQLLKQIVQRLPSVQAAQ